MTRPSEPDLTRPVGPAPELTATRRAVMHAGAGSALGLAGLQRRLPAAADAQEAVSPTADLCLLTAEETEGPYYLELEILREDITEGRPGLPLQLEVLVADAVACTPLAGAAVDIWHCDAQGYYSGFANNPGGNADPDAGAGVESGTFLRGIQLTGDNGVATFQTIYPGWYSGRTIHIHLKVHVDGEAATVTPAADNANTGTVYEGGHVLHTGQLYFDDAVSDMVYETYAAYAGRDNTQRTRNDTDNILGANINEPGFIMALTPLDANAPEAGYLGQITVGVDPAAT